MNNYFLLFYMNAYNYVLCVPCGLSSLTVKKLALNQSLNYEILQTKANFPLGKREDFHGRKSCGSLQTKSYTCSLFSGWRFFVSNSLVVQGRVTRRSPLSTARGLFLIHLVCVASVSRSLIFLCSPTPRKRLLRRL